MMESNIRKPTSLEKIERGLKKLENDLYVECSEVVYSAIKHTFEIDPADPEMPAEWMEELERGEVDLIGLQKRKRIAQYALMPPKEAPVALQMAAKVLGGMQKAKAMAGAGPKHLNLTYVSIAAPNQPVPLFPEKEIEHE